jgi:hypothetical protein
MTDLLMTDLFPSPCNFFEDLFYRYFFIRYIFFGVKLFYATLEDNFRPVGGHLRHRANLNLAADLRTALKTVRAESGNWPLIEPLLQRLTDVVRA